MGRLRLDVEATARRMVLEIVREASVAYWLRRAAEFDRVGNEACDETADACRAKAAFLRAYGPDITEADLDAALAELDGASAWLEAAA